MIRRLIIFATAIALVFGPAACGKKAPLDPPDKPHKQRQSI
jgi:predicted small lipoprotein YifL